MAKLVIATPLVGGTGKLDPGFKRDDALQDDLEDVLRIEPSLRPHAFAVVDLTEKSPFGPLTPAYAGSKDTEQRSIGSMAKLLALYGAYSLHRDLTILSGALSVSNLTMLATILREHYRRIGLLGA